MRIGRAMTSIIAHNPNYVHSIEKHYTSEPLFTQIWLAGQDSNLRIARLTVTCLSSLATGQKHPQNAKGPDFLVGALENSNLNLEYYGQTNPEGRTRLTRRLIMDLVEKRCALNLISPISGFRANTKISDFG